VVEILSPGPLTTVQDLGRPGWAHVGVPRSGAADRPSLRLANRLVGNLDGAAALETTLIGPKLRIHGGGVIALTGAPVRAKLGGIQVPMNHSVQVADGEVLTLGTATSGLRTYVAVRGGIAVPTVLGSAATDVLTGLGPAPVAKDDVLPLGDPTGLGPPLPKAVEPEPSSGAVLLRIVLGPRAGWFTADALRRLTGERFTVTAESNRVGLRLSGAGLERVDDRELLSEGLVPGSIQVPPTGQPILLLTDHPTTGGYPVIATLLSASLATAAQLRPGQVVGFHE
jgi:biotin-dependent carboxylase-like uncharacterized protein